MHVPASVNASREIDPSREVKKPAVVSSAGRRADREQLGEVPQATRECVRSKGEGLEEGGERGVWRSHCWH